MNSKSTLVGKCITILITFTITSISFAHAGAFYPKLTCVQSRQPMSGLLKVDNQITITELLNDSIARTSFAKITDDSNGQTTKQLYYRLFNAAASSDAEAKLVWVTGNEINNDHFEVERSFDKENFNTIGLVFGPEENISASNKYEFTDKFKGLKDHKVVYYRLKQIDLESKYLYSDVHIVRFNTASKSPSFKPFVEVSPNPSMENVNISFSSGESGVAVIRMVDATGHVVDSKQSTITSGLNRIQLTDLSAKGKGLYLVNVIINRNVVYTQKVVKQ